MIGQELPIGRVCGIGGQSLPLPLDGFAVPHASLLESFSSYINGSHVFRVSLDDSRMLVMWEVPSLTFVQSREPTRSPSGPFRLTNGTQYDADVDVAGRQVTLKLGNYRIGVGKFLLDCQRGLVGLSASAVVPMTLLTTPTLLYVAARSHWNRVTPGLESANLLWIAGADSRALSSSRRIGAVAQHDREVVVAAHKVALKFGNGGVGVGELLLNRQCRLMGHDCLGRITGCAGGYRCYCEYSRARSAAR